MSLLAPFAAREVLGHVEAVAHGARVVRHEGTRTRRDGSTIDVLVTVSPICDEGGTVVGASSIACDITDRKRTEADLAHRATHDDLTGLPNRLLLVDRMAQALARCERDRHRELVVLFLDLDGLKLINDTAGHPAGDAVLVAIAERLRAAVRPSDTVARFAGDEFVVVCEDTDRVHGEALGYRIADELAGPVEVGGRTISPSLSIGLSIGSSGDTADELLKQADIAMYEAKAAGGGRLATFDRDLQARLERHVLLDAALRRAVDEGEFRVVYQPIVSLDTGRIVSAEALLRWDAPDPAWAMPSEFIPAAEANGLIVPIGAWVVDEVVRQVEAWAPHLADDFSVSINLSAAQLTADLADTLFALRDRHIDPRRITFELTETVLLADDDLSIEALLGLKLLGARIALDDFGTGYSSLSYLQRLPVDTIKIDRSFITSIASRRESAAIVEAVTTMARTLGLSVTAEGVETGEHLDAVKALGCTFAQGYYWSSAVSADEFLPLLAGATAVSAAGHAA